MMLVSDKTLQKAARFDKRNDGQLALGYRQRCFMAEPVACCVHIVEMHAQTLAFAV